MVESERHTLNSIHGDLCVLCLGPFSKTFPVKRPTSFNQQDKVLQCNDCGEKVHGKCAAKVYATVQMRGGGLIQGELHLQLRRSEVQEPDQQQQVQTKSGEFMHVPKEQTVSNCSFFWVPISECSPLKDWTCDRCCQQPSPQPQFCLLCEEDLGQSKGGLTKLTECILNDNDRTWVHLGCARWHEEIRVESKKRFLFTDKKALRQNEDKSISDCYVCDSSKTELLVKCLQGSCQNYAHPSCLQSKDLSSYQVYMLPCKGKAGFTCGCSKDAPSTLETTGLVDKDTLEWSRVDTSLTELDLRHLVKSSKDREQTMVCEACSQVITPTLNNLAATLAICKTCHVVCHKKQCNTEGALAIKDLQCANCRTQTPTDLACQACGFTGPLNKASMHPVCSRFMKSVVYDRPCLHCSNEGGVIKCLGETGDKGVHPFCHLSHLKSLHVSNLDFATRRFDTALMLCFEHSKRRMKTRSNAAAGSTTLPGESEPAQPVHHNTNQTNEMNNQNKKGVNIFSAASQNTLKGQSLTNWQNQGAGPVQYVNGQLVQAPQVNQVGPMVEFQSSVQDLQAQARQHLQVTQPNNSGIIKGPGSSFTGHTEIMDLTEEDCDDDGVPKYINVDLDAPQQPVQPASIVIDPMPSQQDRDSSSCQAQQVQPIELPCKPDAGRDKAVSVKSSSERKPESILSSGEAKRASSIIYGTTNAEDIEPRTASQNSAEKKLGLRANEVAREKLEEVRKQTASLKKDSGKSSLQKSLFNAAKQLRTADKYERQEQKTQALCESNEQATESAAANTSQQYDKTSSQLSEIYQHDTRKQKAQQVQFKSLPQAYARLQETHSLQRSLLNNGTKNGKRPELPPQRLLPLILKRNPSLKQPRSLLGDQEQQKQQIGGATKGISARKCPQRQRNPNKIQYQSDVSEDSVEHYDDPMTDEEKEKTHLEEKIKAQEAITEQRKQAIREEQLQDVDEPRLKALADATKTDRKRDLKAIKVKETKIKKTKPRRALIAESDEEESEAEEPVTTKIKKLKPERDYQESERRGAGRERKSENIEDQFFDWNDITSYFRRIQQRELDILKLINDYGVGTIRKGNSDQSVVTVESVIEKLAEARNVKPQSSDLTAEVQDMGDYPDKYAPSLQCGLLVKGQDKEAPFSQLWMFKEPESSVDATEKLLDAAESTKASPTESASKTDLYTSEEPADASGVQDPCQLDFMIDSLQSVLDTEKLTRKAIKEQKSAGHITNSQAKVANLELDIATDKDNPPKESDLPGLWLDQVLTVGKRDRETFIEPYQRAYAKAARLIQENSLPFTPLNFELLAMTIMAEDEVSVRIQNTLQGTMLRRVQEYDDELLAFEAKMESKLSRSDFATLFNMQRFEPMISREYMGNRSCRNPFEQLQAKYGINTSSDDNSFYQIEDVNKRASRRVRALHVFESLVRTYRASATQPFVEVPPPIYLAEIDEYVDTGLTLEDMLIDAAERGCQICFTLEAQNCNPIMYCKECNSGVHARCFGDDFSDEIDKTWICHYCRERRQWFSLKKKVRPLEQEKSGPLGQEKKLTRAKEEEYRKLSKALSKKEKRIKKIKCFLCGLKGGFMRYQKKLHSDQGTQWYHPFCVMSNSKYSWRKLVLIQQVVYTKEVYDKQKFAKHPFSTCSLCAKDSKSRLELCVECHECKQNPKGRGKQKFHPMCAWLNGNQFKFDLKETFSPEDGELEKMVGTVKFQNMYYKKALGLKVRIKCNYCVERNVETAMLRKAKFDHFSYNQQTTQERILPWYREGQTYEPIDMRRSAAESLDLTATCEASV